MGWPAYVEYICLSLSLYLGNRPSANLSEQIGNSNANRWPLLVLAGSVETQNVNKGGFQEMDAVSLLTPHAKLAIRPPYPDSIPDFIADAYRTAYFGRPGTGFVDLPADMIMGAHDVDPQLLSRPPEPPQAVAPIDKVRNIAQALKNAKAPLVVIGKGAAYARAETQIRKLIDGYLFSSYS